MSDKMNNQKQFINNLLACFGDDIQGNDYFIANMIRCLPRLRELIIHDSPARSRDNWLRYVVQVYEDEAREALPVYQAISKKEQRDLRGVCFDCCYILLYIEMKHLTDDVPMEDFLTKYPEFAGIEIIDLGMLKQFHFMMSAAQKCLHPTNQKQKLLEICTHLTEGTSNKYITGRGQTAATTNRVLIYERVAGSNYKKRRFTPRLDGIDNYVFEQPNQLPVELLGGDFIAGRSHSMILRSCSLTSNFIFDL